MLAQLEGRLTWERTVTGIRVLIPARRDWGSIISGIVWGLWAFVGLCVTVFSWKLSLVDGLAIIVFGSIESISVALLAWNLRGKTTLILDPREFRIARAALGVEWSSWNLPVGTVRNLRYIPPTAFRFFGHWGPGQMRFEANGKTRKFATGLKETEALALIERMIEIYEFPRDRASEYIGIRR